MIYVGQKVRAGGELYTVEDFSSEKDQRGYTLRGKDVRRLNDFGSQQLEVCYD